MTPPPSTTTDAPETTFEQLEPERDGRFAPAERPEGRSDRLTVIEPAKGWLKLDLHELWTFRELAGTFAWRDFKVRYKQTYVGIFWALIQPFGQMIVAVVIFGKFAKFPSDGPYPLFTYSGLLLWGYFSGSITRASNALVGNSSFVTKIYFPRVLLPVASVVSPLVDFMFASVILVLLMIKYQSYPGVEILASPFFLLLAMGTALGVGMSLASINVRYRDVPYTLPYLMQIWTLLSPVYYSANHLPQRWQWIFALNPMTGVLGGWRWSLGGAPFPPTSQLVTSIFTAIGTLIVGLIVFKRQEPRFADNI